MTPPFEAAQPRAGIEAGDRLPLAGLLPLAMAGLVTIMTELMPAGLLPQMSAGLGVSPSVAGQTITAYAAGSLFSAIPLMTLTQTMRRRRLLLLAILGFALSNVITAVSGLVEVILIARFFGGMAGGLVWALLAGYAKRMSPPHLVGRAIAVTGVGAPLAYSLGIPAGTWLGAMMGWRFAFGSMSLVALGLCWWTLARVPDYPGVAPSHRMTLGQVARLPGIAAILFVTFAFVVGHNILYTYITPILAHAGITERVDAVLLTFGLAGLIGVWVAGAGIDRHARPLMLANFVLFGAVLLAMTVWGSQPVIEIVLVAVWGLTLGAAPTIFQTASSKAAGEAMDVAQGIFVTAWNSGVAIGGARRWCYPVRSRCHRTALGSARPPRPGTDHRLFGPRTWLSGFGTGEDAPTSGLGDHPAVRLHRAQFISPNRSPLASERSSDRAIERSSDRAIERSSFDPTFKDEGP